MNTVLLITRFTKTDGGCIFLEKFSKIIFNENRIIELEDYSKKAVHYSNLINKPFIKLIQRLPFGPILNWLITKLYSRFLINDFTQIINNNCSKIIVTSGDDLSFLIGLKLKKMGYVQEIHFTILDFPWTYKNSTFNNWIIKKIYLKEIKAVDSADCISDGMFKLMEHYRPSLKLYQSSVFLDSNFNLKNKTNILLSNSSSLEIGFAGNLRFKKEMIEFIEVMSSTITNFKFHFFSNNVINLKGVINRGFISSDLELINELQDLDFGFVPLSFDSNEEELIRTSFPSKTFTYIKAQIPIIAFVPEYSALAKFLYKYRLGIVITNIKDINMSIILEELNLIKINWENNLKLFETDNRNILNILKEQLQ
jgi:hypothetical protein